jgi:HEAT repeat protein
MDLIEDLADQWSVLEGDTLEYFLVDVLRRDPDPIVRHEAAFVLRHLKTHSRISGNIAKRALCTSAREDESIVVRHEAMEALHCFEGKDVECTLLSMQGHNEPDIRATAAISLERRKHRLGAEKETDYFL